MRTLRAFRESLAVLLRDEDGASMVEYAVSVGTIAAAVIAGTAILGPSITAALGRIAAKLDTSP